MNVITFLYIFSQISNSLTHRKARIAFFCGQREYQLTYILFTHHNFHLLSLIFLFFISFISSLRRSLSHFLPSSSKLWAGTAPPSLPPPGKPRAGVGPPLLSTLPPARGLSLFRGARPPTELPRRAPVRRHPWSLLPPNLDASTYVDLDRTRPFPAQRRLLGLAGTASASSSGRGGSICASLDGIRGGLAASTVSVAATALTSRRQRAFVPSVM
jgi:hypothetical protein